MGRRRKSTDALKLELARRLQEDCNTSNRELAEQIDVDAATLGRVRSQLEKGGFIQRYRAHLDPDKYGFGTLAFLRISLENKDKQYVKSVERFLADDPNIVEMHALAGEWDYLLKIRVRKSTDLKELMNEKFQTKYNIKHDGFMISIGSTKDTSTLPI